MKNRTLVEMTRCLLHDKELPKNLWVEAANTAVFLLNRLPTKALQQKTPFEAWYGYKPKLQNLKTFGCLYFSYTPQVKRDKLDKKAEPEIFVGYNSVLKAYKIYLPQDNKVIVSRDIQFFESKSWNQENNKLEFQEKNAHIDDESVIKTRSLSDIYQSCNVAIIEPAGYVEAVADQHWMTAMKEELMMIEKNQTWMLVNRPAHKKTIRVKWVYRTTTLTVL